MSLRFKIINDTLVGYSSNNLKFITLESPFIRFISSLNGRIAFFIEVVFELCALTNISIFSKLN